ncbi:DUF1266 domain-containing protein [Streptomyces sp. NPDC000410]|uniref:DUF1266 domain-containing protein n=1 Tax=Streptomyces sp. NPDC000410 TaxID=3154254 RepID=UPI0033331B35
MTTASTGWVPPTETEQLLSAAGESGDPQAELAVLARARLFLPVGRLHADTPGSSAPLVPVKDPLSGKWSIAVFTAGMLPRWHPEWVHRSTTLAELARDWPNDKWRLAVNPGTPCATSIEATRSRRRTWQRVAEETGGTPRGLLVTHTGGPLSGALAHGLACGAHLSLHNSVAWNELGTTYLDYFDDARILRGTWRVTNRAQFQSKLTELLEARFSSDREAGQRSTRYEERFRADGVLGHGEPVDSLRAFDYGRIIMFVRIALGARLCDPREAEEAVLAAGRLSRETYASWSAFSAAYCLARVLAFDEDEFGRTYQESVAQHRILTQDPNSPYRSIPWS